MKLTETETKVVAEILSKYADDLQGKETVEAGIVYEIITDVLEKLKQNENNTNTNQPGE